MCGYIFFCLKCVLSETPLFRILTTPKVLCKHNSFGVGSTHPPKHAPLRKSPRIYNLNTVYLHYPLRVRSGLVDSAHLEAVHDDAHVFKVIQRIASHQAQETHGRQRTKVELVERNLHKISARRLHTQRGEGVRGLKGCMSRANG